MTARQLINDHLEEFLRLERYFTDRVDRARREMRAIELGITDSRIIQRLGEVPFAPTPVWLSSRLNLNPGHVSRVLGRLQLAGLLEVVPVAEGDARTKEVSLTTVGVQVCRELAANERRHAEDILDPLPASQRALLLQALRTIRTILDRTPFQNYLDCAKEETSRLR